MRIVVFSTLYPTRETPAHGVFVENRLRAFLESHDADVRVIAPVPWFPLKQSLFGKYAVHARTPLREVRHGVTIWRPRYVVIPKIGMRLTPDSLASAFRKTLASFIEEGWAPDFVDAHYLYPDGVAAARICVEQNLPLALTARGTDVSLIAGLPQPKEKILKAITIADQVVTVADALRERLILLGAPPEKIKTLRNGVDLELFHPLNRESVRHKMGLSGLVFASVGHLIERKGHHLAIEVLHQFNDATLLIAGEGEERRALELQALKTGVANRVQFLGAVPHEDLINIYNAADALILASSREGWPNVLLEAMACGTPCVATNVWGNAEVISSPKAGRLAKERSVSSIVRALNSLSFSRDERAAAREHAEAHSWIDTAKEVAEVFTRLKEKSVDRHSITTTPVSVRNNAIPQLIVTVDTEEVFNWAEFEPDSYRIAPIKDIARFQNLCEQLEIAPLYFLSHPLINDQSYAFYFKSKIEKREADCGLHMHSWVTPPNQEYRGEYYSYQKNLPTSLHRDKLMALADAFQKTTGRRATAHRAGRYGLALENYLLLAEAGIARDFSPSPAFDFSKSGGADFSGLSNQPFHVHTPKGDISVLPVCGARALRHTRKFLSQETAAPGFAPPKRRHAFTEPVRLSPEGSDIKTMKALTRHLVKDKTPVLTFTLHSTSLTVGANSYASNNGDVDRILSLSKEYLTWFRKELNGEIISLDTFTENLNA